MSKRAPNALTIRVRRASQPSTPSSSVPAAAADDRGNRRMRRLADQGGDERDDDGAHARHVFARPNRGNG